jgi:quinol-cytochrome oxidoreductase complex cytochrome b subunit
MPRKAQPQLQYTKFQQVLLWMKSKPIYTLIIILFIISLFLLTNILTKSPPKEPITETTNCYCKPIKHTWSTNWKAKCFNSKTRNTK